MDIIFTAIDPKYLSADHRLDINNQYYYLSKYGDNLLTWDIYNLPAGLKEVLLDYFKDTNLSTDLKILDRATAKQLLQLAFKDDFRLAEMCKVFQAVCECYVTVVVYRKIA